MKKEHNVARFWVDDINYQSNTVILAELVLRGRPQPVHKASTQVGAFFMRRRETSNKTAPIIPESSINTLILHP